MKTYLVLHYEIINKEIIYFKTTVTTNDIALDIWLNPQFKKIDKIIEI